MPTERPVSIERDGVLHGTLTLPESGAPGRGPPPGVLIIAGSGPVDRDGNLPGLRNDSLKQLAHALAAQGVASIRADKRGVGESTWPGLREDSLRFADYVRDAIAWTTPLRAEAPNVTLLGHSEGALVVTIAAQSLARTEPPPPRLILLAGAAVPAGPLMERQFSQGAVPAALRVELHRILATLAAGQTVEDVPEPLVHIFRPTIQPYLISWFAIDPAAAFSRTTGPALVIQGTTDIQVAVSDARILAASRPGVALSIIEGMNHVLKPAPADRAANVAAYRDPSLLLHPDLIPVLIPFLTS